MRLYTRLISLNYYATSNPVGAYYVDAINGNDSNNGLSSSTAWQTLAKVNSASSYLGGGLLAGNSILFKGGTTISGQLTLRQGLNVLTSSVSNPITISSYGSGDAIISATVIGNYSYGVLIDGISGLLFTGITVTAAANETQYGVVVQNSRGGTVNNVSVIDCTVSGFNTTNGNPSYEIFATGLNIATGASGAINNIIIQNCVCSGAGGVTGSSDDMGISTQANVSTSGTNVTNITVQGCTVFNIGGRPGGAYSGNPGAGGSGDGILLVGVANGLIAYNLVHDCGANSNTCGGNAGQWVYNCSNVIIEYGEVYNQRPWPTYTDGCDFAGFNIDGGNQYCTIRYCYSHDNWGTGLTGFIANASTGGWGPNYWYENISVGDAYGITDGTVGVISFGGSDPQPNPANVYIFNNTIINNSPGSTYGSGGKYPNVSNPPRPSCWTAGLPTEVPTGGYVANNIFYQTPDAYGITKFVESYYYPFGCKFLNNAYYQTAAATYNFVYNTVTYTTFAGWQGVVPGGEVGSTLSNPQLSSSGTSGVASWTPSSNTGPNSWGPTLFQLTSSSSSYLGTGLNLLSSPYNLSVGNIDYYGSTIPGGIGTGYNIGADGRGL